MDRAETEINNNGGEEKLLLSKSERKLKPQVGKQQNVVGVGLRLTISQVNKNNL